MKINPTQFGKNLVDMKSFSITEIRNLIIAYTDVDMSHSHNVLYISGIMNEILDYKDGIKHQPNPELPTFGLYYKTK